MWRADMKNSLDTLGVDYFDPVVADWTATAMANEKRERAACDVCLFTITPKMTGVFSIAEVVDDSNKRPQKTILVLLREDGTRQFTEGQWRSLTAVAAMVSENGARVFYDLHSAALSIIGPQ